MTKPNPDEKLAEDKLLDEVLWQLTKDCAYASVELGADDERAYKYGANKAKTKILSNFVSKDKVREAINESKQILITEDVEHLNGEYVHIASAAGIPFDFEDTTPLTEQEVTNLLAAGLDRGIAYLDKRTKEIFGES